MTENVSIRPPAAASPPPPDASLGELMSLVSEQIARLIRDELRLAQLNRSEKAKHAGLGAGLFYGAGPFARYRLPARPTRWRRGSRRWSSALRGSSSAPIAAIVGEHEPAQATPPVPTEALNAGKRDVQILEAERIRRARRDGTPARAEDT